MANIKKQGKLDRFPLDVGFFTDEKLKYVCYKIGNKMPKLVYLHIIGVFIYQEKGYYCEWNEDKELSLAAEYGLTEEAIKEMLGLFVKRSLFDGTLFNRDKILTSRRIQTTYMRACIERETILIDERYIVCSHEDFEELPEKVLNKLVFFTENHEGNLIKHGVNEIKPEFWTHRIEENRIEEHSIVENSIVEQSSGATPVETVENSRGLISKELVNKKTEDENNTLNWFDPAGELILNRGRKQESAFILTQKYAAGLRESFPDTDFNKVIKKIQKWLDSDVKGVFKVDDITQFIFGWFYRCQQNGWYKLSNGSNGDSENDENFDVDNFFEKEVKREARKSSG
ncbi:MAG: DUF4373 domain-containing protein [Oscillospiraceae bacterium]|nr:DUF4373 domain-containing protein [Oscillospiraceae bacterium]